MALSCTFYTYTGKRNKINKSLTTISSTTLTPYADFDTNNPIIIVDYSAALLACNYIKIDNIYYFVTIPVQCIGNKMRFVLEKDLLMTLKTQIMNMPCIITRSSNNYNSYIYDNLQSCQVNFTTFSSPFEGDALGNSFDYSSGMIYIAAIGGGGVTA